MATATLMQRYTEYNDRLKAQGVKLIPFACPSCNESIETRSAPKGEVWDSASDCPHCNAMFMKITQGKKAYGLIPERNLTAKGMAAKTAKGNAAE